MIYADVLVALNILITYILMVAVRIFCKIPTNKWAVMVASLIGGFSSLIIFWENMNVAVSVFYKLACSGAIVGVGFLPQNVKVLLKAYSGFFLISFLFGGAVYALQLAFKPANILYYNGIVYFDMSISYLVGCVLSVYGAFLITNYLITRHSLKACKCLVEITYNNISVAIPAIVDTGNSLQDGLSGRAVIVAELSAIAPVFNREELLLFKNQDYENVPQSMYKAFRLVPCSGVTGDGLLPSFVPQFVKVTTEKGSFKAPLCTIGVVDKALSSGEYKALVNNNIFENGREENNEKACC